MWGAAWVCTDTNTPPTLTWCCLPPHHEAAAGQCCGPPRALDVMWICEAGCFSQPLFFSISSDRPTDRLRICQPGRVLIRSTGCLLSNWHLIQDLMVDPGAALISDGKPCGRVCLPWHFSIMSLCGSLLCKLISQTGPALIFSWAKTCS